MRGFALTVPWTPHATFARSWQRRIASGSTVTSEPAVKMMASALALSFEVSTSSQFSSPPNSLGLFEIPESARHPEYDAANVCFPGGRH